MRKTLLNIVVYGLIGLIISASSCKKDSSAGTTPIVIIPPPVVTLTNDVSAWVTTADRLNQLTKQNGILGFSTTANSFMDITVDSTQLFQPIDGFGYTLTQGSAQLIWQLPATERATLLAELFGNVDNSIGINYLRVGIGATDLSSTVYSYNDLPAGNTDPTLASFSLAADMSFMVPLLKEIVAINPAIKILATPWSPPVWMKDNTNSVGGSLVPAYYTVYANYFVKYIQAMKAQGITIDAITPQNEPLHPGNNPSMLMTAAQQTTFVKANLGPALQAAGLATKIIVYDHNCDRPDYPLQVMGDAAALPFIDGSAFHLYAGDISALSTVHAAFPAKNVYFTEQYTASGGNFGGDLRWHIKNVVIGSVRNWSRIALEWNLANDASYGPHTPGGCTTCLGALTISGGTITRNVAYYIIGHASKFVPAGSKRISSNSSGNVHSAAFLRPDGKKVLIVLNDDNAAQSFNIKFNNKWAATALQSGAVATYTW
ncbi:MAG: glucosylceramidase [Ferruginibacter sp.]|nr:glucosylceramidase [Ferruginibacter sp.]